MNAVRISAVHFPALRMMDRMTGMLFGLIRGMVVVYVLFLLVPVISTVVPGQGVETYLAGSKLAGIFINDGFFARVVNAM